MPRRSRIPAVSCTHRTVGRSTQDSRNQLGIPLPALESAIIKFCQDLLHGGQNLDDPKEGKCG